MPPLLILAADSTIADAFWQGLFAGLFELVGIGLIALVVNVVWQRYRERSTARRELIDEIDAFTVDLYGPRKIYQLVLDRSDDLLAGVAEGEAREQRRQALVQQSLEQLIGAIGRFRAVQIKMVPLFGYDRELFGYYLAIWRYLKEIRSRVVKRETLYFHHEQSASVDAFYRLIDSFRYGVATTRHVARPPAMVRPPQGVLEDVRTRGNEIYEEFFGSTAPPAG